MFIDEFLQRNDYVDSTPEDIDLFNLWAEDHPEYIIHYKTNSKAEIITVNEVNEKTYHIIWDSSFWKLFTEYIYIGDEPNFSPNLDINILKENSGYMVALFFNYFSKRYDYYPELSKQLMDRSYCFGYAILRENLYGNEFEKQNYDFLILLAKSFAFWHEIAHAEFHKFDTENSLYQRHFELVYSILEELLQYDLSADVPNWKNVSEKIRKRNLSPDLIEELAADLRAIQRMLEFKSVFDIKKNLNTLIRAIIFLIEFATLKSILDKRWDHFVARRPEEPQDLTENQIIRRNLFPQIVYIKLGVKALGDSFLYDMKELRNNIYLFQKILIITCEKWYVSSLLNVPVLATLDVYSQIAMLNTVYHHMSAITVNTSSKRLKYLFNIAHTIQHSDCPLNSIPMFHKFIDMALKKGHENKRNIADAYSRIARVYAENGQPVKSEILLNNAIDIAYQLSTEDIGNAFLYNNIGNVFKCLGREDEAFRYYFKSMKMRQSFGDTNSISIATVYRNLGSCPNCGFYHSLKYYLKSYLILKFRYDHNNPDLIGIKKELSSFANHPRTILRVIVPFKTPLSEIKDTYEHSKDNFDLLEKYLFCMVRDLLSASFDDACRLYINIVELVEANKKYPVLSKFYLYAFINFQDLLKEELE